MATTDIIARLQLKAEQFSSETGQRFAELKTRARSAAGEVRTEFLGAFSEVQRVAKTALVLPRTEMGSLDLSRQIAQLNASASAAENDAAAHRELGAAFTAAAAKGGENATSLRLQADAAMVAERQAMEQANALRGQATAYEAVQAELAQTTSATRILTAAQEEQVAVVRRSGAGFTNLGQQFIDFTVQVQGGQRVTTALTQQLPQASFALSTMGGAAGRVGAILTGPFGTAATIALIALSPLVGKLWEGDDAGKAAARGVDAYTESLQRLQQQAGAFSFGSDEFGKVNKAALEAEARVARLRTELAKTGATGPTVITPGGTAPANLGRTQDSIQIELNAALADRDKTRSELNALLIQRRNREIYDTKAPRKPKRVRAPRDYSRQDDSSEEMIARINAEWDEQPKLVDRARVETLKLDNLIERLQKRKLTPEVEKLIAAATDAKKAIQEGLDRPFRDFVEQQRQSLAIGQLTLEGRDAEAEAMANAVRLQETMGPLTDAQLRTVLQLAEQHERINRTLEDQRRVIGIYENAWSGLTDQADRFFAKLQGSTGGVVGVIQKLQRDLLSNALFGGVDREIETYIRQMTGKQTPAEIVAEQAKGAGAELRSQVNTSADALADFIKAVRGASSDLRSIAEVPANDNGAPLKSLDADALGAKIDAATGIVVRGNDADKLLHASGVLGVALEGFATNLRHLGVDVPKSVVESLKKNLPTVLEGAAFGQLGGSVFSKITGGKEDKTASAVGGVLGEVAGKALGPSIAGAIGGTLGKTLGGAAGPIGSIVGGILGNLVGGLFHQSTYGTAVLSSATSPVNATGKGSGSIQAASGLGGSVQQGLTQLADQLGATLGAFDTVVGVFDGKYRVRTTASGWDGKGPLDFKGSSANNLYNFGDDEQAAIAFAIADAVKDGAIKGLSAASEAILASGQDLTAAVNKVMLIEAIPKDLKAMLDPVGAAVDDLNRKWQKTKAALVEGGASVDQLAQAEKLYNLQLEQVKNSTASASQTLKDFTTSLKLGSGSPYSLRDQESTALAQLKPFLDQIALGQTIDQGKYTAAANAAIDVERQIYGSTKGFFDFLDTVQAATNKAISSIDNAVPVSKPVESPFAKATADATKTLTEQTDDTNALLTQIAGLMQRVAANTGGVGGSDFIGADRQFKTG